MSCDVPKVKLEIRAFVNYAYAVVTKNFVKQACRGVIVIRQGVREKWNGQPEGQGRGRQGARLLILFRELQKVGVLPFKGGQPTNQLASQPIAR